MTEETDVLTEEGFARSLVDTISRYESQLEQDTSVCLPIHDSLSYKSSVFNFDLVKLGGEIQRFMVKKTGYNVSVKFRERDSKRKRDLIELVCSRHTKAKCKWRVSIGQSGLNIYFHAPNEVHSHEPMPTKASSSLKFLKNQILNAGGTELLQQIFNKVDDHLRKGDGPAVIREAVWKNLQEVKVKDVQYGAIDALTESRKRIMREPVSISSVKELTETLEKFVGKRFRTMYRSDGSIIYVLWTMVLPEDIWLSSIREWTMDTTFNTNSSGMTLLGFCAQNYNRVIVPLAFALCSESSALVFKLIMKDLKLMLPRLRPIVHKADGERALHIAAVDVFGGYVKQCRWHLAQNVISRFPRNREPVPFSEGCSFEENATADLLKILKNESEQGVIPSASFLSRLNILLASPTADELVKSLKIFHQKCTPAESEYFEKYIDVKKLAKFVCYAFGSDNDVSSDAESVWAKVKANLHSKFSVPPSVTKLINEMFEDLRMWIRMKEQERAEEAESKRQMLLESFGNRKAARSFLEFCKQFTPGAQLKMIPAYLDHHTVHRIADEVVREELENKLKKCPNTRCQLSLAKFTTIHGRVLCSGLVLAHAFLNDADLPKPLDVFEISQAQTSLEFLLRFEEGYFCTCGKPLQTGLPCSHVFAVVRHEMCAWCIETVAPEYHMSAASRGHASQPGCPRYLKNPYFVRDTLISYKKLSILLGNGNDEIPEPKQDEPMLATHELPSNLFEALEESLKSLRRSVYTRQMPEADIKYLINVINMKVVYASPEEHSNSQLRLPNRSQRVFRKRHGILSDLLRASKRRRQEATSSNAASSALPIQIPSSYTRQKLRKMCRERSLPSWGTKLQLWKRLLLERSPG